MVNLRVKFSSGYSTFPPVEKEVTKKVSLLNVLLDMGVNLTSICGGKGVCGKCKIKVNSGKEYLNKVTPLEHKQLSPKEINEGYRLSCRAVLESLEGVVEVEVPQTSLLRKQVLQVKGVEKKVEINPLVKKYFLQLPKPTLNSPYSDEDRIINALIDKEGVARERIRFSFPLLRDLPKILRDGKWEVTVTLRGNEIISVEKGDTTNEIYGFAVDVGTTKVAGFLVNLKTGETLVSSAIMNPQIVYGEDVISRISYVIENGEKGLEELQKEIVKGINKLILDCCGKARVKEEEIYEHVLVGNTCMQLLFLGIWPQYLAFSPYTPVIRRGISVESEKLGIIGHPRSKTYFLPVIGGFVGADNVAVIIATDILESEKKIMAIDIGTNTEIDLGNKEQVMAASCASGPAFEGMHIKHGMKAAEGAIERVNINPFNVDIVDYVTIGETEPIGLCGSAMVDIVANLYKTGLINNKGTFNKEMMKETERLRKASEGYEFVIAWKKDTGMNEDIVFTQKDVREIQKAKAAIYTGSYLLMQETGIKEKEINKVLIAGAFGNYIDPENARLIGMYPEFPLKKIEVIGNAAGTGARLALISKEMRNKAEEASKKVKYLELGAHKNFNNEYLKALYIPHKEEKRFPETIKLLEKLKM